MSRLGCAGLLLLSPRLALGLGPAGSAIETSAYTVDFYQGPITSSSRVIGLAGSVAPLIEGVGGYPMNPASVAMRQPWSLDWWDWELDVGFTLPASISNTDFDNNGDETFATNAAAFFNGGLGFQFGAWGIGFSVERGEYGVESNGSSFPYYPRDLQVAVVRGQLVTGYAWGGGELVLGYGINVSSVELGLPGDDDDSSLISSVQGLAMQFGAVWAPPELPLRVGLSARVPVSAEESLPDLVEPDAAGNYVSEG